MDDLLNKCINQRINIIINEFRFNKRREEHPEECPCNSLGPCHNIEDLNCFFCYCPWYENETAEGGCKIGNPLGKGKWFDKEYDGTEKIWDCSECVYPHKEKTIKEILSKLFTGRLSP